MWPRTTMLFAVFLLLLLLKIQVSFARSDAFNVGLCKDLPSEQLNQIDPLWIQVFSPVKTWDFKYSTIYDPDEQLKFMQVFNTNGAATLQIVCERTTYKLYGERYEACQTRTETVVDGAGEKEMVTDSNGDGIADMKYYVLHKFDNYMIIYKCSTERSSTTEDTFYVVVRRRSRWDEVQLELNENDKKYIKGWKDPFQRKVVFTKELMKLDS